LGVAAWPVVEFEFPLSNQGYVEGLNVEIYTAGRQCGGPLRTSAQVT
jgi:hypothetical protein